MSEPDSESCLDYFTRRVREVAAEIGATVVSCGHARGRDEYEAQLTLRGEYGFVIVDPATERAWATDGLKRMFRELVDRDIANIADQLYAVTHTEIPAGAVFMMRGARRVFGSDDTASPITKIDRAGRRFWRFGTSEPFPWPAVTYYNQGRQGIVERTP